MENRVEGLQRYLKVNEIENHRCDMEKPFVFISYSHHEYDAKIVRIVFNELYSRGINVWIDTANLPVDGASWTDHVMDKVFPDDNFKVALFFRSENSMISQQILKELKEIERNTDKDAVENNFIAVDIWSNSNNAADNYYGELIRKRKEIKKNTKKALEEAKKAEASEKAEKAKKVEEAKEAEKAINDNCKTCRKVTEIVREDCNAIRLAEDCNGSLSTLVEYIVNKLMLRGIYPNHNNKTVATNKDIITGGRNNYDNKELSDTTAITTQEPTHSSASSDTTTVYIDKTIKYILFGKEYTVNTQAEMYYNALDELQARHQSKIKDISKEKFFKKASSVTNYNTKSADPSLFRVCKEYDIDGEKYILGSSLNIESKVKYIYKMLEICGENPSEFKLLYYPKQNRK